MMFWIFFSRFEPRVPVYRVHRRRVLGVWLRILVCGPWQALQGGQPTGIASNMVLECKVSVEIKILTILRSPGVQKCKFAIRCIGPVSGKAVFWPKICAGARKSARIAKVKKYGVSKVNSGKFRVLFRLFLSHKRTFLRGSHCLRRCREGVRLFQAWYRQKPAGNAVGELFVPVYPGVALNFFCFSPSPKLPVFL